jgi:hypothetical protein
MTSQNLDVLGYWWLPEHADHKVPGRLIWDEVGGGGSLELLGELRPVELKDNVRADGTVQRYRERRSKLDQQYPVIHGQTRDEGYTLLNSWSINGLGLRGLEEAPERVSINGVLVGAWYSDTKDIEADRATFDLRHLTAWVGQSGIDVASPLFDGDADGAFMVITANHLPPLVTAHGEITVKLRHYLNPDNDGSAANTTTEAWKLVLETASLSTLEILTDVAIDIRALVTVAAGKASAIERAVIQHPTIATNHAHLGRDLRDDITYYSRWAHRPADSPPMRQGDFLFDLAAFGGIATISSWLSAAQIYSTELRRVMATRYTDDMYLEDRIMNTSAALESFDCVRRNNVNDKGVHFVDRIVECVTLAGPQMRELLVEDAGTWAKRVKAARNHLAHHGNDFRTTGTVGERLLAEQLYWLFAMCILRVAQAPESTFESISANYEIRWLTDEASARVGD